MSSTPSEHVVLAGRRVTGVTVVADDQPLRSDIPTLRFSRFAEFIKLSNVEIYQGLLNPPAPTAPFGFIWAPRLERVTSDFNYIVPAEVMQPRCRGLAVSCSRMEQETTLRSLLVFR